MVLGSDWEDEVSDPARTNKNILIWFWIALLLYTVVAAFYSVITALDHPQMWVPLSLGAAVPVLIALWDVLDKGR